MKQIIMMDDQEFRAQVQSIVLKEISRSSKIAETLIADKLHQAELELGEEFNRIINDKLNEIDSVEEFENILNLLKTRSTKPERSFQPWSYEEDQELKKDLQTFIRIQARNHTRSYSAITCRIKKYYDTGEDV